MKGKDMPAYELYLDPLRHGVFFWRTHNSKGNGSGNDSGSTRDERLPMLRLIIAEDRKVVDAMRWGD